jgi:hypothetical protein
VQWRPKTGELLPRAAEAGNIREKLVGYSLNAAHPNAGGDKARGFERILGITIEDVDYLEAAIQANILVTPISSVRHNPPYGFNCVIEFPLRGRDEKSARVVKLRTVWRVGAAGAQPHLSTAYLKP